jgi:glycosyltransferase involved in cell wall biosynthesis
LVISAQPDPALPEQIARGEQPRRDYFELQRALGADLLLPGDVAADRSARLVARAAGMRAALAWLAVRRRGAYDAIYSDGEGVGLPLAALLRAARARPGAPRHVMLTHYLSPAKKRVWFRVGVASHLDAVICHSSAQHDLLTTTLGLPGDRARLLPYFADERFWRAEAVPGAHPDAGTEPVVCAVGLEFRDYDTLAAAAPRVLARIEIAAASHWSRHGAFARTPELPANLRVAGYGYPALRDLYTRSRVVVVPLRQVDNQAGITVILEAMALGKPVIATGTRGQTDVLRDRRSGGRGRMPRQWWPGFVDAPGEDPALARLATGFYVAPDDPRELAAAITYLLQHPDVADELGHNGRRVFDACFTLDAFTARFAAVIRGEDAARAPVG